MVDLYDHFSLLNSTHTHTYTQPCFHPKRIPSGTRREIERVREEERTSGGNNSDGRTEDGGWESREESGEEDGRGEEESSDSGENGSRKMESGKSGEEDGRGD